MSKLEWNVAKPENEVPGVPEPKATSLNQLQLGEPIATGCNAVVYSANIKDSKYIICWFKCFI